MCLPDRAENKDRQKGGTRRCCHSKYQSVSPTASLEEGVLIYLEFSQSAAVLYVVPFKACQYRWSASAQSPLKPNWSQEPVTICHAAFA
ncbi:hypothetical protein NDU88_004119 [Pleurodeles waltl]|uniref:Uncharacterized protein n=1 Tax=Pleurodeles waltl TaxID=8319 RepID=A0AAV7NL97_PLEWA|nr:hypothetical protein NDU88_004119 [Pleurodeles waltl]